MAAGVAPLSFNNSLPYSDFNDFLTATFDPRTKECGIFRPARNISRREYTPASTALVTLGRKLLETGFKSPVSQRHRAFFIGLMMWVRPQVQFDDGSVAETV